jgi:FimV-like protein
MQHFVLILLFLLTHPVTAAVYGPIKTGEMMWGIAGKLNLAPEITRYQTIIALLRANPQSFSIPCNFNSLKVGATLIIPPPIEISRFSASDALKEFSRQEVEWKTHRQGQGIQCVASTVPMATIPNTVPVPTVSPPPPSPEKSLISPVTPKTQENRPVEQQMTIVSQFIQQIELQKIYTSVMNQPIGLSIGIFIGAGIFLVLLIFKIFMRWLWKPSSYQLAVLHENLSAPRSPLVATTNAVIEEKLSTLRLCLARQELEKVADLLQEVSEKGTPIQQFEARQLAEIYKTMTHLQEEFQKTQKLLIAQSNPPTAEATQSPATNTAAQGEYLPQRYLPETKEKVFELVDTIMLVLDKELKAQGQLVEAYQNRQTSPILETEEYQVVNKTSAEPFNAQPDITSRQAQPTRYL